PQKAGPRDLLNSWKEIAAFLDRGVRTVQRWERQNQLPVHRYGDSPRAAVYAFEEELSLWLHTLQQRGRLSRNEQDRRTVPARSNMRTYDLIIRSHAFVHRARELRWQAVEIRTQNPKPPFVPLKSA